MASIDPGRIQTAAELREQLGRAFDRQGLSLQEFAAKAGLSVTTVRSILGGKTSVPHRGSLDAFVTACGQRLEPWRDARARAVRAEPKALLAARGSSRPLQLPSAPPDFTGRTRELGDLLEVCARGRESPRRTGTPAVVLTGPPGVGKTALALRLCEELQGAYPDGGLFSRLREDNDHPGSGGTLPRFLRALGVDAADVPDERAEQAALFRTLLVDRRMLIMLDDAVDEAQVRPLLPNSAGSLVVVTSRKALPTLEGATSHRLDVLDRQDAQALLARVGGPDRMAADTDGSHLVAELCGGLPLALRIAAARLAARTDWTPSDLAGRLTDARRRLRLLRVGDLDVRVSFEVSYRALPEAVARLFRLLAITPGPTFSTALVAVIVELPLPDAEELLDRLILDQLVEPADRPGSYRMHDLIKLFAAELLGDGDSDTQRAASAMFSWYAENLERSVSHLFSPSERLNRPDPQAAAARKTARGWLDEEHTNLLYILAICHARGLDELTTRLGYGVAVLARQRGLWEVCDDALEISLAAADRLGDRHWRALLLNQQGESWASHKSSWSDAAACWQEAVALLEPDCADDAKGLVANLHGRLANAYRELDRPEDEAREEATATALLASFGAGEGKAAADGIRAQGLFASGRVAEAIPLLESVVQELERPDVTVANFPRVILGYRLNLAKACLAVQPPRPAQAVTQLLECLDLCREYGQEAQEAEVLCELGKAYRARGHHARARQAWIEGLEAVRALPSPEMEGRLTYELADHFASWKKDYAEACALFARSAAAFSAANQPGNQSSALLRLALARQDLGDGKGAETALEEALASLERISDKAWVERYRGYILRTLEALRR
ncbi:NB-ARC domain-containing protein [Actinomadura logoneensis]|nr:NB-ARC domain-containing protein [Actinomadura logoneensis]